MRIIFDVSSSLLKEVFFSAGADIKMMLETKAQISAGEDMPDTTAQISVATRKMAEVLHEVLSIIMRMENQ
ncbi:MAG: hypothetical protein HC892_18300 [Saprospiraceae bacterium]|nr:hypothetical protein [Saprospiraceae bacterium]